jgi:deoxyadenosine/deoxycytidine kinase
MSNSFTVVFAAIRGVFVLVTILTESVVDGTPLGLQFVEVPQEELVFPVQVYFVANRLEHARRKIKSRVYLNDTFIG